MSKIEPDDRLPLVEREERRRCIARKYSIHIYISTCSHSPRHDKVHRVESQGHDETSRHGGEELRDNALFEARGLCDELLSL